MNGFFVTCAEKYKNAKKRLLFFEQSCIIVQGSAEETERSNRRDQLSLGTMRRRFKRFFRFCYSLPASFLGRRFFYRRPAQTAQTGKRKELICRRFLLRAIFPHSKLRFKVENRSLPRSVFSICFYFSFSSPRSLTLDVQLYAFGSRTGILHSSAAVEAAFAGADGTDRKTKKRIHYLSVKAFYPVCNPHTVKRSKG